MVIWPGTMALQMGWVVCCEEETADERKVTRHFSSGDVGLVLGISTTGWFRVKTCSINKYFIPVLSPSLLALEDAQRGG